MPVAMARNGTLCFVHPDHLGTPQKVTDASQNLVWHAVLRPFGRIEQESFAFTQLLLGDPKYAALARDWNTQAAYFNEQGKSSQCGL
jgi:hypothetical protein